MSRQGRGRIAGPFLAALSVRDRPLRYFTTPVWQGIGLGREHSSHRVVDGRPFGQDLQHMHEQLDPKFRRPKKQWWMALRAVHEAVSAGPHPN